jgi:hypothetical protein
MAEKIQFIQDQGGGKYAITYEGGSTSIVNAADAKKAAATAGIAILSALKSPAPSQSPSASTVISSNPFAVKPSPSAKAGASASATPNPSATAGTQTSVQVTDPNSGIAVSGDLTVPTNVNGKVVNKTIVELILGAKNPKNLGKIKTALESIGVKSKDPNTVQTKWQQIVVGSAFSKMDPFDYISKLKDAGFGTDSTTTTGTRSYPTITNATDAEANINKAFQARLGRDATAKEIKDLTKTLNDFELKNPTKVTYSTGGQKTFGGLNIDQYLSDTIDKNPTFKQEADKFKQTAPDLIKRLSDKKTYDDLVAKAAGDPTKLQEAMDTTSYGRGLKEFEASLASTALAKGLTNTPDELNAVAIDLYNKGIAPNSQVAADAITNIGKYGTTSKYGTPDKGGYTGTAASTFDTLQKTAVANGLDLNKAFGSSVNDWISAIDKGESVDTFKRIIRETAKIGMPEKVGKLLDQGVDLQAIYTPYKNIMASTLEINPETITLNDPTLRSAITADAEVPLYQFEQQLRKDNRWQYTQQANQEVGDATQKILKDFGFMG